MAENFPQRITSRSFLRRNTAKRKRALHRNQNPEKQDQTGNVIDLTTEGDDKIWSFHSLEKYNDGYARTTSIKMTAYRPCPICHDFASLRGPEKWWFHFNSAHKDLYEFTALETTDKELHLLARKLDASDLDQVRPETEVVFSRSTTPSQTVSSLQENLVRNVSKPKRTYYRFGTYDTIGTAEWFFREYHRPGDEEQWKRIVDHSKVHEFSDVSDKEKHFCMLWNNYIREHPLAKENELSQRIRDFVQASKSTIRVHGLQEQLQSHLLNLWYEGNIGKDCVLLCMDDFNLFSTQDVVPCKVSF